MVVSEVPPSSDYPRTVIATRNKAFLGVSPSLAVARAEVTKVTKGSQGKGLKPEQEEASPHRVKIRNSLGLGMAGRSNCS